MKDILVVVAGTGDRKPVSIKPGTTARDLLDQLGLQQYQLSADGDPGNIIPLDADIYNTVRNGQKVWATTGAEVGLM